MNLEVDEETAKYMSRFDSEADAFFHFGASCGSHNLETYTEYSNTLEETMPEKEDAYAKNEQCVRETYIWPKLCANYFVVFDTETTGVFKSDVVIQFACILCDDTGSELFSYNQLWIPPSGETIQARAEEVHKISNRVVLSKGLETITQLRWLKDFFDDCKKNGVRLVAHNASFDVRLLNQTASSAKFPHLPFLTSDDTFCTQKHSRQLVKALDVNGRVKAPTNTELYFYMTKKLPSLDLHDALNDCRVTASSYAAGRIRNVW